MYTIVWDVDDVLNDLMRNWFECFWMTSRKEYSLSYDDIKENPPHSILGITQNEYLASLDAYRLSEDAKQLQPNADLLRWFKEYGGNFRHIALTATPLKATDISAYWVLKHFGIWIRTYHFVPSLRDGENIPRYDNVKGEFLKWINKADILVDDNENNINEAKNLGIIGLLVTKPWNKNGYIIEEVIDILTGIILTGKLKNQ